MPVCVSSDIAFEDHIVLPASLDEASKGTPRIPSDFTGRLARNFSFAGKAYYRRQVEIPESWRDYPIEFKIERTRVSRVWVDGVYIGSDSVISASQRYDLSSCLSPGLHDLIVMVDNGVSCGLPQAVASSHMWSDDTQTNWNGMLGEISLTCRPRLYVESFRAEPDWLAKTISYRFVVVNRSDNPLSAELSFQLNPHISEYADLSRQTHTICSPVGRSECVFEYPMSDSMIRWSEFSPQMYQLQATLSTNDFRSDSHSFDFAIRKFSCEGKHFTINGQPTFLRGKHDACVFPLTGYAPMDTASWSRFFGILRDYGFNHLRCHSWCPPQAAFDVANRTGFYIQAELPMWGEVGDSLNHPNNQFMLREGMAILKDFAHNPSFVMFSSGNELWGSLDGMRCLTDSLRHFDSRPLFALGSNFFLGWMGEQSGEDFSVVCRVGGENDDRFESHVRASFSFADAIDGGLLNASVPGTRIDFSKALTR